MTQTDRSAWQIRILGMLFVLALGCEPGTERLALVRGKLSHKGAPLSTGTIVFTPDALRGTTGPMARAEIQPDGTYVLQTNGLPGAIAGWHRVTVMAMATGPALDPDQDGVLPRSLLPEKYRDPELSGLSCRVWSGQENCLDFDLD
jgi:hypothetical protein